MTTDRRGRPVVSVHPEILREAATYRRLPRAAATPAGEDRATSPAAGNDQQTSTEPPATP